MTVGMLRDDLLSLPGVESAELDGDVMAPSGVRVRLAPGTDVNVVGDEVRRVLALHGLRPDVAVEEPQADRSGETANGIDAVSVTEGRDGVSVEAVSGVRSASVHAAGRGIAALDAAVVAAVASVAGTRSVPLIRSVDVRDLDGISVVTVMIEESGTRLVGSAVMDGGRGYAVGRAVWAALSGR